MVNYDLESWRLGSRFGSGMTCWRRLRDWTEVGGVGPPASAAALRTARAEGDPTGPARRSTGRTLKKHITAPARWIAGAPAANIMSSWDGNGIPLAVSLTGGNRNDCTQLLPLLDHVGSGKAHPLPSGPAAATHQAAERGSGLRPRQYRRALRARPHHLRVRPPQPPTRLRPRCPPLRRQADHCAAELVSPAPYPLGDPLRDPPRPAHPGHGLICWRRLKRSICRISGQPRGPRHQLASRSARSRALGV